MCNGKIFSAIAQIEKKAKELEINDKLDELKDMLFKCFEEQSVINACKQFQMAKVRKEPCPFSQVELDNMFAKEK